jgi:hypothetical protein
MAGPKTPSQAGASNAMPHFAVMSNQHLFPGRTWRKSNLADFSRGIPCIVEFLIVILRGWLGRFLALSFHRGSSASATACHFGILKEPRRAVQERLCAK